MQFTAAENNVHDLDSKLSQGVLASSCGKIKNPLVSDVSYDGPIGYISV